MKYLFVISTEGAMWVAVTIKLHPLLAHNNKNDTIKGPLNHTCEYPSVLTCFQTVIKSSLYLYSY